jgi:predicted amidohydrolase YtcJ
VIDAGVGLIGGTDSTGTVPDSVSVLRNIDVAVNRRGPGDVVVGPAQAVSREEALAMFTTWASFGAFEEQRKGRLTPGMFADLAVLDADPLDPSVEDLASIPVRATVLGGQVVHESGS